MARYKYRTPDGEIKTDEPPTTNVGLAETAEKKKQNYLSGKEAYADDYNQTLANIKTEREKRGLDAVDLPAVIPGQSKIEAGQLTNLRAATVGLVMYGSGNAFPWGENVTALSTKLKARHLEEIRQVVDDALNNARCTGGCSSACGRDCGAYCTTACKGNCGSGCDGGCYGNCAVGCGGNCAVSCGGNCAGGCGGNCAGGCGGICANKKCSNTCTGEAWRSDVYGTGYNGCWIGGCFNTCGGCRGNCNNTCKEGCSNTVCKGGCSADCGLSCGEYCSKNCGSSCAIGCGNACAGGCGTACAGGCSSACSKNSCGENCKYGCSLNCSASCNLNCNVDCRNNCYDGCIGSCHEGCAETSRFEPNPAGGTKNTKANRAAGT